MRFSLILGLAIAVNLFFLIECDNKSTFNQKLIKLIIAFFNEKELGKIFDKIWLDIYNDLSLPDIAEKSMKYIVSECPVLKYSTLLGIMSKNDNCLKNGGAKEKTMDVLSQFGAVLAETLKPPYSQLKTKVGACKKNNTPRDKCFDQMYKLATAAATKNLVQKTVTKCANTMKCPVWACATVHVNALLKVQSYNTTRTKKC